MKRRFALLIVLALAVAPLPAQAETGDGYDSELAHAVRAATERYRLVVWAEHDGYVQTTGYVASFGTMYTNHERFDPKNLDTPTMLVYDLAGRLAACGYQFLNRAAIFPALAGADVTGWYDVPRHVHYNILVKGTTYYAQQPWGSDQQPSAALLVKMNLMPADATLQFAFVHPPTRSVIIWAWTPNPSGLFGADNPAMP